jgi:hypothetical protein
LSKRVGVLVDVTGSALLALSIGEIPLAIFFGDRSLRKRAAVRYSPFTTSAPGGFPLRLDANARKRSRGRLRFALNGAELDLRETEACFSGAMNEFTLDSFLRVTLSALLLEERGLLLHASTVVRDGRAYVFMGRSGAGKSTIARSAPAGAALTDEISLVRRHAGGWRAHGTPFWGEFRAAGQNHSFPLAGVYALVQASSNRVTPMERSAALWAVLRCALFFSAESRDREALLRVAAELVETAFVARLEFRRELDFWKEITPIQ